MKEAWKILQVDIVELKKLDFEKIDPSLMMVKSETFSPIVVKQEEMTMSGMSSSGKRSTRHNSGYSDYNDDPDDPDPLADEDALNGNSKR